MKLHVMVIGRDGLKILGIVLGRRLPNEAREAALAQMRKMCESRI